MEVIWLVSSESRNPDVALRWKDVVVSENVTATESATERPAAVILEIACADDMERGLVVVEGLRSILPIWIFGPGMSVTDSVRWMKAGVTQIATTPEEIDTLLGILRETLDGGGTRGLLIGRSAAVRSVEADIRLVACRRCNLLIEGETGTGKEVAARETHALSDRCRGPWIAVNCSAIPETLLEAELFGHVKGAFTGAIHARAGKFEAANHGTIFLDEIGDMPLAVQAKLLRVLQEREIERLGGNERIRLDVRVIAATNVNLAQRVHEGLFREDLYYRLNVFRIVMPPLRTRTEDIPILAQYFVERICASERIAGKTIDRFAMDRLMMHPWPGNVRELENAVETAVIISGKRSTIFPSDLRLSSAAPPRGTTPSVDVELPPHGIDYQRVIEEFEKRLLRQALARAQGNKTAAADLLGLKRTTLSAKMRVLESRGPRLVA